MTDKSTSNAQPYPNGVMINAYPDSIGCELLDTMWMLRKPDLEGVFSLFYVLPTFFHSDLDRGFSVIDYDINEDFVSPRDLEIAAELGMGFKFDLVLNHMSVGSLQFQDMLQKGDESDYRDFFIDWNEFWSGHGDIGPEGYIIPEQKYLDRLFMRKPEMPILKVRFPDGSERPYWNTFYQEVNYQPLTIDDLEGIEGLPSEHAEIILIRINTAIAAQQDFSELTLDGYREQLMNIVEQKRQYLGQMDLNAGSEKVWEFYDETLQKLSGYGAEFVRLDAFAYLHKAVGETNFFNKPGTWEYLERLKHLAANHGLTLLPEIHAEYGSGLHEEVAAQGFPVYDFFLPGLVIDALDRGLNTPLLRWIGELDETGIHTVNMLGCHDGIPVLDLRGKDVDGEYREGLLTDDEIEAVIENILARGGRIKNLYGPDGRKIAYYQVNATYFSALGEDEQKLLLARAIQIFTPGIPQVWYLDLFAGKNDYAAADRGGTGGHKEINRTTLSLADIENGLQTEVVRQQLQLLKLRNTHPAFSGTLEIHDTPSDRLHLTWRDGDAYAILEANLRSHNFSVTHRGGPGRDGVMRVVR
ncbi:MAG: glycosidase [Gammaproteobacteria bacterium]|nr:glycosidase [Gammaproteobacteria bacterium]